MFKLSKESKITFSFLLIIPVIWIVLNQFGLLDSMEYKSLDLRFKLRGEVSHQQGPLADKSVRISDDKSVPRIPKVIYVNFDADTLSLDQVGERPWNRGFFRDVGKILLEKGNARVVAYDFIFSPKSTSSMVPVDNVYTSDSAIADLVREFPGQVILASAFTNVQTPFLKNEFVDFLSSPPYLDEGFDAAKMGFRYPEGPTYPIFTYRDGQYYGIQAPITVSPNKVDGMQRSAPLWFPGGGKAHSYNILGGKKSKLALEGVDLNGSRTATLAEVGNELHLVWKDSNLTLVESLPNRMPLIRNRNFHTFGVETLMAYYGVDDNSVELTQGNKTLVIRGFEGDAIIEAPLQEGQEMEINWFSSWKEDAEAEKSYKQAKDFYNRGDFESYADSGPKIMRLFLNRIDGINLSAEDNVVGLVQIFEDLGFDENRLKTANQMISASLGEIPQEDAPDIVEFEKLISKIADNYIPPDLFSEFNPMCGMDNVLQYNEFLLGRRDELSNTDDKVIPRVEANIKLIRSLFYKHVDSPESVSAWSKFVALEETNANLEKSYALSKLDLIGEQLRKNKTELASLLEKLEKFEEEFFPVDEDRSVVNSQEDSEIAQNEFVSIATGLNGMIVELEGVDEVIGNFKKSLETTPAIAGTIQPLLNAKLEERSKLASTFAVQGIRCLDLLKSLLSYNESKRDEIVAELSSFEDFFSQFKDAIVLIGPEEATFQDLSPTPMDKEPVPKVSVHGNIIKTLSSGLYLQRILDGRLSGALLILAVCLILGFLAVNSAPWSNWVGVIFLLAFVGVAILIFTRSNMVMPMAVPASAGISTFFIGLIVMMVLEQKAKGRLKGMFGSYVSADLVDQMVESGEEPHLGGEETAITAFFSDVQAFSSFSELLTPTGLVDLMNEYLTAMTNILQEERGTLDKYIGDAIVAMYGAPIPMKDHAYQSVRTALLMQEKQLELRDKWAMEEEKWGKCYGLVKQMQTRIGCNTGTATVGNMGALDRFNYTMMGDMVNLAARCESGAKAYGAYIMITEETKLASEKTKDDIAFRYLDKIVVKGRSQPVAMYEPTGFMSDLGQETQDCLDCFKQGIDKYLLQDWDGALKMFEKAKGLEPNKPDITPGVKDNPSMILIDRCKVMKENPPGDDWDGVYVMTSK